MIRKVIIASKNPVKINSVKFGFEKMFSKIKFEFEGISVSSGVKDQPLGNEEIMMGSTNRADNAKAVFPGADYWVGIEGGIEKINNEMEVFAWVVIKSKNLTGKARTATFFLPKKVVELVESGKELGEADDIVFGRTNSKQENGAVGILTANVISRTNYYSEAVILALIPFNNQGMY